MQQSPLVRAKQIYLEYIQQVQFKEIQHVPDQFIDKQISLQEECLCISHGFFEQYYPSLIENLTKRNREDNEVNWICELLLVMNGENDKAWNIKKSLLLLDKLQLQRQLKFNAAVCYKNKKSSSYYDFRIKIYQKIVQKSSKNTLIEIYLKQTKLIAKILGRFFRNYFCWMYRNRLFKLFLPYCGQQLVQLQISSLHKFIENNPNDYSAYSRLISVVQSNKANKEIEMKWISELNEFCRAAYEQEESYRHTITYKQFLLSCSRQQSHH